MVLPFSVPNECVQCPALSIQCIALNTQFKGFQFIWHNFHEAATFNALHKCGKYTFAALILNVSFKCVNFCHFVQKTISKTTISRFQINSNGKTLRFYVYVSSIHINDIPTNSCILHVNNTHKSIKYT